MSEEENGTLVFAEPESIRSELGLDEQTEQSDAPDPELLKEAESWADKLVAIDLSDNAALESTKSAVEQMGMKLQEEASRRSEMLRAPIKQITEHGDEGGEVAKSLIDLKITVEELDPGSLDLEPGFLTRLLGMIPGVGTPLKRYFTRFESSQTVIDAIVRSLQGGKDQLQRDNRTLIKDQQFMRELARKLEKAIRLGQLLDEQLEYKLSRDLAGDAEKARFVSEELIFPLRQRVMDLQQQLAVAQQGVLTIEVVIRNNKELIRGVNRSTHVTVNALQVAVTLALALANQKIVLDKVQAINETTSGLIKGTAARLRTQGAEIHKQAASTQIDMEALKSAFRDIHAALEDISNFRREALPKMAKTIVEMNELSAQGHKRINEMEKAGIAEEDVFEIIPDNENW